MTLGLTGNVRAKSFAVISDASPKYADVDPVKKSALAAAVTAAAETSAAVAAWPATAPKSIYHERCLVANNDFHLLRGSIGCKVQQQPLAAAAAVENCVAKESPETFFQRVSRALESVRSRRRTPARVTNTGAGLAMAEQSGREARMEKPMFVTTVRSGVFLEPPPEVATLLGLRRNGSTERLASRKLQPPLASNNNGVVYSFASKPRLVGATVEPRTPPRGAGASVPNRKRIVKRQVDGEGTRPETNGCTMTSTTTVPAAGDGSIHFGGNTMHDRRVARGSNFASLRLNVPTTEHVLSRQAEARRRAAVRQRAQIRARKLRSRTPPPVDGRKHGEMQTEKYLEELPDQGIEKSAIGCQADLLVIEDEDDPSPLSRDYMMTPRIDAQTQLDENELIGPPDSADIYDEAHSKSNTVIVTVVNKILREAILEINAEIEKFQNTKEIGMTRPLTSNTNKENTAIILSKDELRLLLRNFDAQSEYSDWPVIDLNEKNFDALVDDIFEHLRVTITNLDFLANITKKLLELRDAQTSTRLISPPTTPSRNSGIPRETENAVSNNVSNLKDVESESIATIVPYETEQQGETTIKESIENISDSSVIKTDEREIPENLSSQINKPEITNADFSSAQVNPSFKNSFDLPNDNNHVKTEIDLFDENRETLTETNQKFFTSLSSDNVKILDLDTNLSSAVDNDEIKKSDKKSEVDNNPEPSAANPPSLETETRTNVGLLETENKSENEQPVQALNEQIQTKSIISTGFDANKNNNNGMSYSAKPETQQSKLPVEISETKETLEMNTPGEQKSFTTSKVSEEEDTVESNKSSNTELLSGPNKDVKSNDSNISTQQNMETKTEPEIKTDEKGSSSSTKNDVFEGEKQQEPNYKLEKQSTMSSGESTPEIKEATFNRLQQEASLPDETENKNVGEINKNTASSSNDKTSNDTEIKSITEEETAANRIISIETGDKIQDNTSIKSHANETVDNRNDEANEKLHDKNGGIMKNEKPEQLQNQIEAQNSRLAGELSAKSQLVHSVSPKIIVTEENEANHSNKRETDTNNSTKEQQLSNEFSNLHSSGEAINNSKTKEEINSSPNKYSPQPVYDELTTTTISDTNDVQTIQSVPAVDTKSLEPSNLANNEFSNNNEPMKDEGKNTTAIRTNNVDDTSNNLSKKKDMTSKFAANVSLNNSEQIKNEGNTEGIGPNNAGDASNNLAEKQDITSKLANKVPLNRYEQMKDEGNAGRIRTNNVDNTNSNLSEEMDMTSKLTSNMHLKSNDQMKGERNEEGIKTNKVENTSNNSSEERIETRKSTNNEPLNSHAQMKDEEENADRIKIKNVGNASINLPEEKNIASHQLTQNIELSETNLIKKPIENNPTTADGSLTNDNTTLATENVTLDQSVKTNKTLENVNQGLQNDDNKETSSKNDNSKQDSPREKEKQMEIPVQIQTQTSSDKGDSINSKIES